MKSQASDEPATFPWTTALAGTFLPHAKQPNFLQPSAVTFFQQQYCEACATAGGLTFKGIEAITRNQLKLIQTAFADSAEGINLAISSDAHDSKTTQHAELSKKLYQQAVTNAYGLMDFVLQANMRAIDILNRRYAEATKEIGGLPPHRIREAEFSKQPELINSTYENAAANVWQFYSQAQNAVVQAWAAVCNALAENVGRMGVQAGNPAAFRAATTEAADIPKEVSKRSASDTEKLRELVRDPKATALDLLQKRVSEALKEFQCTIPPESETRVRGAFDEAALAINSFQKASAEGLKLLIGALLSADLAHQKAV